MVILFKFIFLTSKALIKLSPRGHEHTKFVVHNSRNNKKPIHHISLTEQILLPDRGSASFQKVGGQKVKLIARRYT